VKWSSNMAIPESQLKTWSHQGSITQSSTTYNTIKNVLEAAGTPYSDKTYSVFLQGSYGNDTNIYAESDVDIVIKLDDCFQSDLEALSQDEKNAYKNAYVDATYTHVDFKRDVLKVLTEAYGVDVKVGDKAIAITAHGNRRKADVITAIQFRRYYKFKSTDDQSYDEGICFYNSAGEIIANYPKQHSTNLTRKHQDTNKWLKPMVRVLKNIRGKLVKDGYINDGVAPSYYVEGLLYNVPNDKFGSSFEDCFVNAINWIQNDADKSQFVSVNEQYYLLRNNMHTCWSNADCEAFLNSAIGLWNDW
jgi:hypothetical protein